MADYTSDLQKLFLEMFLADAESFVRAQNIFRYDHYDMSLREPAKFVYEYAQEYKTLPDVEMVNAKTGSQLQSASDQNILIGSLMSMKDLQDTKN